MTTPTDAPTLPDDLALLLAAHNVPATVEGLLDWFEARYRIQLDGPIMGLKPGYRWKVCTRGDLIARMWVERGCGPTRLIALARAFVAMVESEATHAPD